MVVHDQKSKGRAGGAHGCSKVEVSQSHPTVASLARRACREFWMLALFERRQAVLDCQFDHSGKIGDVQLLHHAAAVGVHRFRG